MTVIYCHCGARMDAHPCQALSHDGACIGRPSWDCYRMRGGQWMHRDFDHSDYPWTLGLPTAVRERQDREVSR